MPAACYCLHSIKRSYYFLPLGLKIFFNYLFLREREEKKRERERIRERGRQRIPSRLHADSREPHVELQLRNCESTTWAKVGCLTDWATQFIMFISLLLPLGLLKCTIPSTWNILTSILCPLKCQAFSVKLPVLGINLLCLLRFSRAPPSFPCGCTLSG